MGYLGSSLDDYYSYQLIDKVIEQIDTGDTGDTEKRNDRLNQAVEKFKARNKKCQVKSIN